MDDDKRNKVKLGVAIACLVAAAVIIYFVYFSGDSTATKIRSEDTVYLLCLNPECNYNFEMSLEEYLKQMKEVSDSMGGMPMSGQLPLTCPKCNEDSLYRATKCAKCGEIFVTPPNQTGYRDRCPKCGYSQLEDQIKGRKK